VQAVAFAVVLNCPLAQLVHPRSALAVGCEDTYCPAVHE
jgi:hypothetical protein